jgi:hypothetical protein
MAHWAEVDKDNIVLRVLVTENNYDEGYSWLINNLGGTWIQTSYNARIRKNFAGIGYKYDESRDAFIPPQPYPSWTLNEQTCHWNPPKPYPSDEKAYIWNESILDWEEFDILKQV